MVGESEGVVNSQALKWGGIRSPRGILHVQLWAVRHTARTLEHRTIGGRPEDLGWAPAVFTTITNAQRCVLTHLHWAPQKQVQRECIHKSELFPSSSPHYYSLSGLWPFLVFFSRLLQGWQWVDSLWRLVSQFLTPAQGPLTSRAEHPHLPSMRCWFALYIKHVTNH